MPGKIAYLMSRFPHLPETFILREMIELERIGWQIELYPLIIQEQSTVHAEAGQWIKRARYVPIFSLDVLSSNIRFFLQDPRLYLWLWWMVFKENLFNPAFLARAFFLLPKAVRMAELMKEDGIRHIHAHYATHPALVAWIIHMLTKIPYSVTVHAHDIFKEKSMLAVKMQSAKAIVAISEFNRRYLIDYLGGWVDRKIHVVHCGVNVDAYLQHGRTQPNSVLRILSIGSLQPYKGQLFLVRACSILHKKGINFDCIILGGGKLRKELDAEIQKLGLSDIVKLAGPKTQKEVLDYLGRCDCYVQPSIIADDGQMEGIPVALMEAMASSIPVIATEISGVPELVQAGKTGWAVPQKSAAALADSIADIAGHWAAAKIIAENGQRLVKKEFSLPENVQKLGSLFETFIRPRDEN